MKVKLTDNGLEVMEEMKTEVGQLYKCLVDVNKGPTQRWAYFVFMPVSAEEGATFGMAGAQRIMWIGDAPKYKGHPPFPREGWIIYHYGSNEKAFCIIQDGDMIRMPADMVAPCGALPPLT